MIRSIYRGKRPVLARVLPKLGHVVFDNNAKDFNLNIVGVRARSPKVDEFRCALVMFWRMADVGSEEQWVQWRYPYTTLPGRPYLVTRLLNPRGCAILMPGQYRNIYKLDIHGGKYEALCQRNGPVSVYRDGNRDEVFDLNPETRHSGHFGINLHGPKKDACVPRVGWTSAGCQVFQCWSHFVHARSLWRLAEGRWGNSFTYTLVDQEDAEIDL